MELGALGQAYVDAASHALPLILAGAVIGGAPVAVRDRVPRGLTGLLVAGAAGIGLWRGTREVAIPDDAFLGFAWAAGVPEAAGGLSLMRARWIVAGACFTAAALLRPEYALLLLVASGIVARHGALRRFLLPVPILLLGWLGLGTTYGFATGIDPSVAGLLAVVTFALASQGVWLVPLIAHGIARTRPETLSDRIFRELTAGVLLALPLMALPHLLDDGSILLFDNAQESSRVPWIDEHGRTTREWTRPGFFTRFCGAVQPLPNGNVLASESLRGRAVEVTSTGEVVWEFRTPWSAFDDREKVANLLEVQRVAPDYGDDWL